VSDFSAEIRKRVRDARQRMHEAAAAGDDYLAQVLQGELEGLTRLANDHQVTID
jgi:hypothetical protein